MTNRIVGAIGSAAMLLCAPALVAGAQSIVVSIRDPYPAKHREHSVAGDCASSRVAIAFSPGEQRGSGVVAVTVRGKTVTFAASERFVREIFLRPERTIWGMDLFCEQEPGNPFYLQVQGVSAGTKSENAPRFWTARVDFTGTGALDQYKGIVEHTYAEFMGD